jgi:hypothetical protein
MLPLLSLWVARDVPGNNNQGVLRPVRRYDKLMKAGYHLLS